MTKWHPDRFPLGTWYDWQGKPIDPDEWVRLRRKGVHVAKTDLRSRGMVSTVWLGLDHGYWGGPPIIFETMIFGGILDGEMGRYATVAQARRGHTHWVRILKGTRRRQLIHNGGKPRG